MSPRQSTQAIPRARKTSGASPAQGAAFRPVGDNSGWASAAGTRVITQERRLASELHQALRVYDCESNGGAICDTAHSRIVALSQTGVTYPAILGRNQTMTRKFQFVAVFLALVIAIGALPLSARCERAPLGAQQRCTPHCPMMMTGSATHGAAGVSLAATSAPARANCCNVSTSRPEASVQLQPPSGSVDLAVSEQLAEPLLVGPQTIRLESSSSYVPRRSALCILRI